MILLLPMSFKKDKHKYSKDRFIIEDDYWLGKIGPVYETKDKETIRSYNYHNYFRSMEVHESKLTKKWWDYQRKVNEKKQIEISLYTNHIPYFYFDRETLTFMNNKIPIPKKNKFPKTKKNKFPKTKNKNWMTGSQIMNKKKAF